MLNLVLFMLYTTTFSWNHGCIILITTCNVEEVTFSNKPTEMIIYSAALLCFLKPFIAYSLT